MPQNQANPHNTPAIAAVPVARREAEQANPAVSPSEEESVSQQTWRRWFFRSERIRGLLSFQVSLLVHCAVMIGLALLVRERVVGARLLSLVATTREQDEPRLTLIDTIQPDHSTRDEASESVLNAMQQTKPATEIQVQSPLAIPEVGAVTSRAVDTARKVPVADLLVVSTAPSGGGLQGRNPQERARLVAARGGSEGSEQAVELGLRWLAEHQRQNGSWWLDHQAAHGCACRHPGIAETAVGATALALLPFLGAGYTQETGPYQDVIGNGLEYLLSRIKYTQVGGDLREGVGHEMYSHGLAAIVLCEAYAMTADSRFHEPAQSTIDFICNAQHGQGGWRYKPGQPGDTTVTGWQVMALKSARMAQLHVPAKVIEKAELFLNRVQDGRGAFYGYLRSGKDPGPTSVGLLLRMYLGWHHDDDRLERGVNYLARRGPSTSDMYYNYYVTQVLHHYGGNSWSSWNKELREFLIRSQAAEGHERGSWFFADRHGSLAGRHYTTAICIMILEVYYRHMPLYGEGAVDFDF